MSTDNPFNPKESQRPKNGRRGLLALTIVHAVEFSRIGRTSPTGLPTSGLRLPVPSTNRRSRIETACGAWRDALGRGPFVVVINLQHPGSIPDRLRCPSRCLATPFGARE